VLAPVTTPEVVEPAPDARPICRYALASWRAIRHSAYVTDGDTAGLPETLTLDEAFRAAYYMIDNYVKIEEPNPRPALVIYRQYLWSDPARWSDWLDAVRRALSDEGEASPVR
jgi:hypothetical protein